MYHIEKNTVQETLIIPLYGRKVCSEHFPNLFKDPGAVLVFDSCNRRGAKMMTKTGLRKPGYLMLAHFFH